MRVGCLEWHEQADCIIAKLTDTKVEVRPSVSVQKALKDSMAELAKEVSLLHPMAS